VVCSAVEVACLLCLFVRLPLAVKAVSYVGQQQAGQLMEVANKMHKTFKVIPVVAIAL
jgi:hypothetical protein